jgi:hypothetical protein
MSIDGYIEKVTQNGDNLVLELTGRTDRYTVEDPETGRESIAGGYSPAGQSRMTILDATWTPEIGMVIWGSASSVIIEANPKREYKRWGYTTLIEIETYTP